MRAAPSAQGRHKSEHHLHHPVCPQKRFELTGQIGHGHPGYVGRDEKQAAHGRRDHAQCQVVDHDHGKVDGVDAELGRHRCQDGHQDHHPRQGFDEDAKQQQKHVEDDLKPPHAEVQIADPVGHQLRDTLNGQHPSE